MNKYYVNVRARTNVLLEETYAVTADDPIQAEKVVASGGGELIDEEILEYFDTTEEYVFSVTMVNQK